jgi:hypothetical protein
MARLSPWPGGLPSGPGLTDGAAAPDAVRCASIIPPETEVALVAPPPSPGTAPGTPPGAAPGGNPPIVITVDPPNPGIIFPPAPGSTPVGDPVSIAADPDGSGTGSSGNAVGASATTGAGNGGVTIFQAARTPSLLASQPRFQASADAADHPNPNYHERTVLALTDRNHISAVSIRCDAHRAGSAQTGSTQPGNAPPSLPSTVLAACGDSPDRTATPDQPQDGIGFAGPASSAGAEDTEIADFGIFADVDSPVPSHRGRVHGGSLASEVAAVIPVASVASRPLVKPVTIGATGAVFAGWMFRRRRSTAK